MSHSGMRELGAKNAAVPRLDVLSLRLHRLWIVFHQLDGGERSAVCLLLHETMEGAHAEGIDESLLRLDAEQKALEQPCRVGTGRGLKDGARSDDERRALARINDLHRRTPFPQQQKLGAGTVGLHGTLAACEPVRRIARRLQLHDLLLGEPLEIGPAQIARKRKCCGKDGAAIVRISLDDFALPSEVEQIGKTRRCILGLDQVGVVADGAERGECRRVHAIRTDLFGRQVPGRVLRQERRKPTLRRQRTKCPASVLHTTSTSWIRISSSLPMRWNTRSAPDRFTRTLIPGYLASSALLSPSATGISMPV